MYGRDGIDVVKSQKVVVFKDFVTGNFPFGDLTKDTHSSTPLFYFHYTNS